MELAIDYAVKALYLVMILSLPPIIGASVEELRELLGKGRAKKGIFEGDLKEGELEIGQVASLFWEELSVEEVMKELIRDFKRSLENVKTQLCS